MTTVTLTFVEGKSSKFYTLEQDDKTLTIRFGRIGTSGQEKVTKYKSDAEAKKEYDKLLAEKKKKGYVEEAASEAEQEKAAEARKATVAKEADSEARADAKAAGVEPSEAPAKGKPAAPRKPPAGGLPAPALEDPAVPGLDLAVYRPGPLPVPEKDPTPFPSGDFVIEGYTVSFGDDDEVLVIDAKGKKLKSVPDKLRKHDDYQALMRGRKDDRARERRARRVLEERMISRVPLSAEEVAWLFEDDAFSPLLKGAVVAPVRAEGGAVREAGVLLSLDAQKGPGLLPLDYDARWLGPVGVELVHPMTVGDMTPWQDLLVDLGMQQALVQVFREIKNVPAAQKNLTESSMLSGRNTRSASVVERVLMEDGWIARRGMARRKMTVRVATDQGDSIVTVEAWFDYGEYYMPSDGTSTGSFGFNAVGGKPMKFVDVPEVLVSETIRSLEVALAQAGAKKGEDSEEEEGEEGEKDDEDAEDAA